MSSKQPQSNGEVKFTIVPVDQMPDVTRNKSKYQKIIEAAKNVPFGQSVRTKLGSGDKVNRNAAVTLKKHVESFPHVKRDGKEYAITVATRTEGDSVFAYIYHEEYSAPTPNASS